MSKFLEKHAPLKRRKIRGNHKPFMTKGLSKAIMNRSKLKNIYNKWPSRENFLAFKKSRNYCNSLNRKTKRQYFKEASSDGVMNNEKFCDTIKPFMTNKGFSSSSSLAIEDENGVLITDPIVLAEKFNSHYINIVQNCTGKKPIEIGEPSDPGKHKETISEIIAKHDKHPSILKIKSQSMTISSSKFKIKNATAKDINTIIKPLDSNKATGPDSIPPKIIKLSADIIDYHLSFIINKDLQSCVFH